jgi:hypothetical protein
MCEMMRGNEGEEMGIIGSPFIIWSHDERAS